MRFWQDMKDGSFKHLGALLAGALTICSIAAVGTSYWRSCDRSGFINDFLLNLGTEIFGIAVTIGFVDYLITRRNKREHKRALTPRVRDLLMKFQSLRAAYDNYLTATSKPPPDAIERYITALRQTAITAIYLVTLVDEQQPVFASLLSRFISDAESQFAHLDSAAAAVRYSAMDAADHIERIRTDGQLLLGLSDELRSQVTTIYAVTTGLDKEHSL